MVQRVGGGRGVGGLGRTGVRIPQRGKRGWHGALAKKKKTNPLLERTNAGGNSARKGEDGISPERAGRGSRRRPIFPKRVLQPWGALGRFRFSERRELIEGNSGSPFAQVN